MGFFDELFGSKYIKSVDRTTFVKEFSKENQQINDLKELLNTVEDDKKKSRIEKEIYNIKAGLEGEHNVHYELLHSSKPLLCLHDIRIEHDGFMTQNDFMIFTKQFVCILETKLLKGNVTINNDESFVRSYKDKFGKFQKEGMYSPIEQNKRHINLVKKVLKDKFNIENMPMKSLVILANPKTILDVKYAKKEVNYFAQNHKLMTFDYKAKFQLEDSELNVVIEIAKEVAADIIKPIALDDKHEEIMTNLKAFRLQRSRQENIKAYCIFSNEEMKDLIEASPKNKEEFMRLKGFAEIKYQKYGEDIIKIISGK